jgi:hypothetical protein
MDETPQLGLPLLQPSQAQKHVTMNEALSRIDAVAQLVLVTRGLSTPPAVVAEGLAYGVPFGAVNAWSGQDGKVAFGINGGWEFVSPRAGWQAWIADEGVRAVHDGSDWHAGLLSLSPNGAGMRAGLAEITHEIGSGASSTTMPVIPSHAMVIGVTLRVTAAISGTLTSWQLGTAGAEDRFGSGLGLGLGSWGRGLLGSPLTYYEPTPMVLTATGGNFAGGAVRVAVHYLELNLPAL